MSLSNLVNTQPIPGLVPNYEGYSVDIAMIDSRGSGTTKEKKWVDEAKKSALNQVYPGQLITLRNRLRTYTIGECWNEIVRQSEADLIFFLGDDDTIVPEMTLTLVGQMMALIKQKIIPVVMSCTETQIDEDGKFVRLRKHCPTGLIWRDILLNEEFDEKKLNKVDTDYHERVRKGGGIVAASEHFFGYHYRQHSGNVSGSKIQIVK